MNLSQDLSATPKGDVVDNRKTKKLDNNERAA
jgi:hypothetical protein